MSDGKFDSKRILSRASKIAKGTANSEERFILDYEELASVAQALRDMGETIVMTKGVYDMIHIGHARYLDQAKQRGSILVVSIDTDELTRVRKGPSRPVVPQDERRDMILALRSVDVVTFRSGRPEEEEKDIAAVRPSVLVTSSTTKDYTDEKKRHLKEKYGVSIVTLEPQADTSTTARVRLLMIDGATDLAEKIQKVVSDHLKPLTGEGDAK